VIAEWRNGTQTFVKRAVGVGGDRLRISRGILFRNGKCVDEPYVSYPSTSIRARDDWPRVPGLFNVTVPLHHVFLPGDNRARSLDSRLLGSVPESSVLGVVQGVIPLDR
jgi:signal peptidase I